MFPVQRKSEQRLAVDLETTTAVLAAHVEEQKKHPKLVALLEPFPELYAPYLRLMEWEREAMEEFRSGHAGYFRGEWTGDSIQFLVHRDTRRFHGSEAHPSLSFGACVPVGIPAHRPV